MAYRIASFNVNNLSYGGGKDLDLIAKIINDNDLDIVAMQEVLSEGKALTGASFSSPSLQAKAYEKSLLRRLHGNWEVRWGDPKSSPRNLSEMNDDRRGEGYAFLWRSDRFMLPRNAIGKEIEPQIWSNYRVLLDQGQQPLFRNPFYARFRVKNLNIEIRLITTHIVYGSNYTMRQKEFEILAGQIYPRISEYYKDVNCVVPYTIILGDYNLNLMSSGSGGPLVSEVICFDSKGRVLSEHETPYCTIHTVQNQKTTLKHNEDGYANNYDHFSFDNRVQNSIIQHVSVIDIPSDIVSNDESKFSVYRRTVSDHLPIVVDIDFR